MDGWMDGKKDRRTKYRNTRIQEYRNTVRNTVRNTGEKRRNIG
jgi:hypothetical protein